MISSMTGFGAAEGAIGDARASVEIRSVNHRFFSPSLKLPAALARWEGEVREILRQKIAEEVVHEAVVAAGRVLLLGRQRIGQAVEEVGNGGLQGAGDD